MRMKFAYQILFEIGVIYGHFENCTDVFRFVVDSYKMSNQNEHRNAPTRVPDMNQFEGQSVFHYFHSVLSVFYLGVSSVPSILFEAPFSWLQQRKDWDVFLVFRYKRISFFSFENLDVLLYYHMALIFDFLCIWMDFLTSHSKIETKSKICVKIRTANNSSKQLRSNCAGFNILKIHLDCMTYKNYDSFLSKLTCFLCTKKARLFQSWLNKT